MEIQVFGETELENRLSNGSKVFQNIISINDPGSRVSETIHSFASKLLVLHFKDLDHELPNHDPVFDRLVSLADIEKALGFAREIGDGDLTIHCWQGIARSTAIAMCILHSKNLSEDTVERRILEIRPYAKPNELILRLYDSVHGSHLHEVGLRLKSRSVKKAVENYQNTIPNDLEEYSETEESDS